VTLNEALPGLRCPENQNLIDSTLIDNLLTFDDSWNYYFYPRALTIRSTFLSDACLIRFIVQHPYCDADGDTTTLFWRIDMYYYTLEQVCFVLLRHIVQSYKGKPLTL